MKTLSIKHYFDRLWVAAASLWVSDTVVWKNRLERTEAVTRLTGYKWTKLDSGQWEMSHLLTSVFISLSERVLISQSPGDCLHDRSVYKI